jgi:hypothetical protein
VTIVAMTKVTTLVYLSAIGVACLAGCGSRSVPQQRPLPSEPSWGARFGKAQAIQDQDERDEALNSLALDAAADGRADDVKQAVAAIKAAGRKDQASHGAAVTLAKKGHGGAAKEVAQGIADEAMRAETLQKVAEFK